MDSLFKSLLGTLQNLIETLIDAPEKIVDWPLSLILPSGILITSLVIGIFLQAVGFNLLGSALVGISTFIGDLSTKIGLVLLQIAIYMIPVLFIAKLIYGIIRAFQ
ncbi:hypothetical protein [Geoglobus ahangari]|uniref:hypothetical protein n=1 Tax=Geoglobus ahangari TaxID=113653 RepID=UPI00064F4648|nr:hypothetical protein [Geoglobus ahangari]